jgi:hypothetical protein
MRRVRTIHALRAAAAPVGASFLVLALSLYLIGREVWVARVFANMPDSADVLAVLRFFTYAFLNTHLSVQTLLLLSIAAAVWLVREAAAVFMPRSLRLA